MGIHFNVNKLNITKLIVISLNFTPHLMKRVIKVYIYIYIERERERERERENSIVISKKF